MVTVTEQGNVIAHIQLQEYTRCYAECSVIVWNPLSKIRNTTAVFSKFKYNVLPAHQWVFKEIETG